jgi:head-tail adaptor
MGDIGQMRHRVTIKHLVLTPDGMGGNAESYTTGQTIWTQRKQLRSNKAIEYGIDTMTKGYEYIVRKHAVTPVKTDLIIDDGVTLRIAGIEEVEDGMTYTRMVANEKE